jgi:sec-independent protein translocase protein TatB
MLNFGWAEMMVIGVVALIVIGPEDLPDMFRQLGRFTAKLRQMSREFSRAMEQAAKESGVKDVASDLKAVTSPKAMGLDAVKSAADKFEKWDPIKNAAKPTVPAAKPLVPPPMPATPAASSLTSVANTPAAQVPVTLASEAVDDLDEALDDLALEDIAPPTHGPATQALYDKQALRAQVLAEQTAKLKAIEEGTYQAEPTILPPEAVKPAPKKRVTKPKEPEAAPEAKPARKPRKKADPA